VLLGVAGLTILGVASTASAATAGKTVTPTITPDTGLTNGESVTMTASGLTPASIGNLVECNSDAKQPTVHDGGVVNSDIPVSCTAPSFSKLVTVTAGGTISGTFNVVQGTNGPPCGPAPAVVTCPATDSTGGSPTTDAALFPCPPTAAQQAIGDVCTLAYGDEASDAAQGNILFGSEAPPSATPTTAAPTATTPTTKPPTATTVAPVTGASSGTTTPPPAVTTPAPAPTALATTGPGPAVGWLAAVGGVLLLLGLLVMAVVLDLPRRAMAGLGNTRGIGAVRALTDRDIGGSMESVRRRVGDHVSDAPEVARSLGHRVASASTRTAAWFLGR
jgi:hypothetical protein